MPEDKPRTTLEKLAIGAMGLGLLAFVIMIVAVVISDGPTARRSTSINSDSSSCPVESYRNRTEAIMAGLNPILASPDLSNGAWVADTLTRVQAMRRQAEAVSAADCLALKHETFVFTFRHLEAALESAQAGDFVDMNQSLDLALLNQARFQDWTVDVER